MDSYKISFYYKYIFCVTILKMTIHFDKVLFTLIIKIVDNTIKALISDNLLNNDECLRNIWQLM